MKVTPSNASLHATVTDIDLGVPLSRPDLHAVEAALAKHGVLVFLVSN